MTDLPIWDVHGHYLPESAYPLLASGRASVAVEEIDGVPSSIRVNDIVVGATVEQLGSAENIIASMDRAGLDTRILTPPPFTYRYWDDPPATLELCRLLNEATADIVSRHPDRLLGLCTVPLQDPRLAVAELERAVDELGLPGLGVGTNVAGRLLSDPSLRSVFRVAADRELPVLVHPEFVPSPRYMEYYLVNILGMPVETGATVAGMALNGMLEELSTLRLCFLHGGGVAPYLLGRWGHSWRSRNDTSRDSSREPRDQLSSIYWDTLTHSPSALSFLVESMGAERVVVGTDAPFDMEDPEPLRTLDAAPRLTDEEKRAIRSITPVRWLYGAVRDVGSAEA